MHIIFYRVDGETWTHSMLEEEAETIDGVVNELFEGDLGTFAEIIRVDRYDNVGDELTSNVSHDVARRLMALSYNENIGLSPGVQRFCNAHGFSAMDRSAA